MPRTADEILQQQLGQLTYNIAVLAAQVEKRDAVIAGLRAELAALEPPAPPEEVN
jgi:hypothetical protein